MKNKKHDRFIASALLVAYWSTITYAACAQDARLIAGATLVFGVVLYAAYAVDRAQKSRQRLHETIRRNCRAELEALERAREMREAD